MGIADDETHAHFTALLEECGAMLWGRATYELMEAYWPAVAAGDVEAPPALQEWARVLEDKPKYVASRSRRDYDWHESHHLTGDLATAVAELKEATPDGVLVGSAALAGELDRLGLVDEYRFLVHPVLAGRGPRLFDGVLADPRTLELVSAVPMRNGVVAVHYRRAGGAGNETSG